MNKLIVVAAAVLTMATSAVAGEPQNNQSAKQEKKICKTEKITGSLTRVRRTCLTQREWNRLAEGTRRNVDTITRDANQGYADAVANRDLRASGAGQLAPGQF